MKPNIVFKLSVALLLVLALSGGVLFTSRVQAQEKGPKGGDAAQAAVSTAFTYQGRLTDTTGNPIAGPCDFKFTLHDAASGGSTVGTQTKPNQSLNNGYFSAELNFGASAFEGEARWMEVSVACPTGGSYTPLTGRVALTATPYAHSLRPGAAVEGSDPEYVLFVDNNGAGDGLRAYSSSTAYDYAAVYGFNNSTGSGVFGTNTGGGYGVYGKVTSGGYGVYSSGKAHVEGNLTWKAKTSYASVSAAAFRPVNETYSYANWGNHLDPQNVGSAYYYASVQLPHGANVNRMKFYWNDTIGGFIDAECKLFRNDMAGGGVEMASVTSYGNSGAGSSETTSISYPLVDNSQYAYYLQWWMQGSTQHKGYGVVIEYTFTGPY